MSIKEKSGIVISNKMQKTIVVQIENRFSHPIYNKIIVKTKKYLAHDEFQNCTIGDLVIIRECRPLSKRKHWRISEIVSKSSLN